MQRWGDVAADGKPSTRAYEPPRLSELGRVSVLTLVDKKHGASDGFTFLGDAHHSITAHS